MPLPRIWRAYRWAAEHPSADALVRAYFGIKEPAPRRAAPARLSTEDEILGLGAAFGMRRS